MRIAQSKSALLSHLDDQLQFLRSSSVSYDNGFIGEAKRLALVIRILVHDTQSSVSLLTSLDVKDKFLYYDHHPAGIEPGTVFQTRLRIQVTPDGPQYLPHDKPPAHKHPFSDWWNNILIVNSPDVSYTRKQVVLSVANTDGGGHVDPKLDESYASLIDGTKAGWTYYKITGEKVPFLYGPQTTIVRDAASELELTLQENLEFIKKHNKTYKRHY